jgi:hypothetical protein
MGCLHSAANIEEWKVICSKFHGISCSLSLLLESTDIIRLEKQKKKEIK